MSQGRRRGSAPDVGGGGARSFNAPEGVRAAGGTGPITRASARVDKTDSATPGAVTAGKRTRSASRKGDAGVASATPAAKETPTAGAGRKCRTCDAPMKGHPKGACIGKVARTQSLNEKTDRAQADLEAARNLLLRSRLDEVVASAIDDNKGKVDAERILVAIGAAGLFLPPGVTIAQLIPPTLDDDTDSSESEDERPPKRPCRSSRAGASLMARMDGGESAGNESNLEKAVGTVSDTGNGDVEGSTGSDDGIGDGNGNGGVQGGTGSDGRVQREGSSNGDILREGISDGGAVNDQVHGDSGEGGAVSDGGIQRDGGAGNGEGDTDVFMTDVSLAQSQPHLGVDKDAGAVGGRACEENQPRNRAMDVDTGVVGQLGEVGSDGLQAVELSVRRPSVQRRKTKKATKPLPNGFKVTLAGLEPMDLERSAKDKDEFPTQTEKAKRLNRLFESVAQKGWQIASRIDGWGICLFVPKGGRGEMRSWHSDQVERDVPDLPEAMRNLMLERLEPLREQYAEELRQQKQQARKEVEYWKERAAEGERQLDVLRNRLDASQIQHERS